jgi:NADH-quinone oxidoreductase subunit G
MLANLNVSEPKPLQDDDSPFTFTMEGYRGIPPAPLVPFFWAPGWNSVQSVSKYQEEPGGSLKGGDPGIKLFTKMSVVPDYFKEPPEAFRSRQQKWLLLPQYHVLGSGEQSSYTPALKELSPRPFAVLSGQDARQLDLEGNGSIRLYVEGKEFVLPVQINEALDNGIMMVSAGLQETEAMCWGAWVKVEKSTMNSDHL